MFTLEKVKSLTTIYRCLNNLSHRNFGIYTNETLKKNFDEKLKEKYFAKDQKEHLNPEDEKAEKLYDEMKQTYEDVYKNLQNEESILRSYKKQIIPDEEDIIEDQQIAEDTRFIVSTENHFRGISTSEFMKRSKNLIDSFRNKQHWNPEYQERISDEYLEYDKYRKNFVKLRDVRQPQEKQTEEFSLGSNIINFMRNLDDNMKEKKTVMTINDRIKKQIADPEAAQEAIEQYWKGRGKENRRNLTRNVRAMRINLGEPEDGKNMKRPVFGRVSPHAREQIYKLHSEGWSVRDLSIRYGLLPERIKVIVWNRQYFYDEILPTVDLATIQLALEKEMMYSMFFPWIDYGGDLAMLAQREQGIFFQRFRTTEIDANPPKDVQEKMEKVIESKKKKRYDIVTENFVGQGPKGFYVKSWIVHNGHGSERVNRKFKMTLQHTHNPQLMPDKVRKRLKEGPRKASEGYGIK